MSRISNRRLSFQGDDNDKGDSDSDDEFKSAFERGVDGHTVRFGASIGAAAPSEKVAAKGANEFARGMHDCILQVARQFAQRWLKKDVEGMTHQEVVELAVSAEELAKMSNVLDLLAILARRVVDHRS